MKRYSLLLFFFGCFFLPGYGQTSQPVMTVSIHELLARFPASDAKLLEQNMQAIAAIGQKGMEEMAGMLAAPGKGDNSALEYAISGFSSYAT